MGFSNNIWITRKSRINTSERLKSNDSVSQFLIIYYSFFLIVITILDSNKLLNKDYNEVILILSILILVVSVYVLSKNFKERSLRLQSSYNKMNRIYREVLKKENLGEDISSLEKEYDDLIELTENHSNCDYLQVLYDVKEQKEYDNEPFTISKSISLCICKMKRFFVVFVLLIIPILFIIYIQK